ncbi:MAG: triose-phosphate isomerase [Chloroflexi bacterium]|nr:MAG: triose-phosphate isomerase [Chloroflexota bacterium]
MTTSRGPRRALIAGNWKMNPASREEAVGLANTVVRAVEDLEATTVLCPPTMWLVPVASAIDGRVGVGAQTMAAEEAGAFTGETSPLMLRGIADWVILGHSERRHYNGETDETVRRKVVSAVDHGLRPILAIGERLEERKAGATEAVIDRQLRIGLTDIRRIAGSGLVIAYEPVWAIGTGNAATGDDAQGAAAQIRGILRELDADGANEIPILYGGSVTPDNAREFFAQPEIDGALVGGASLDATAFGRIVARAAELRG